MPILDVLSSIGSAVVLPLVLLWVGNGFTKAIKEREIQGKFVKLAVQILREEPNNQAFVGLRDWATQVLNNYSGVPFSDATKKALIETTSLPSSRHPYEGRAGLGNVKEGDGEKFVGRGYVEVTGRANYAYFSKKLGIDLLSNPERAEEPKVAASILALRFKSSEGKYAQALLNGDRMFEVAAPS